MCWLNTNRTWDMTYLLYILLYIQRHPHSSILMARCELTVVLVGSVGCLIVPVSTHIFAWRLVCSGSTAERWVLEADETCRFIGMAVVTHEQMQTPSKTVKSQHVNPCCPRAAAASLRNPLLLLSTPTPPPTTLYSYYSLLLLSTTTLYSSYYSYL